MTGALVGLAVLCAAGALPAVAMAGLSSAAVFLSMLVGAACATLAAVLTVGVGGPPLLWFLAAALLAGAPSVRVLNRRVPETRATGGGVAPLFGVLLALVPAISPRVGYDAHAIWLVHSRLLLAGHGDYVRALGLDAFLFANPDYPPAAPASVAVAWQLTGVDTRSGQLLFAMLTAAAVALLAGGVATTLSGAPRAARLVIALVLPLAAFGIADGTGTVGYVDLLWSAAIAAAAVWGLVAVRSAAGARIALVCAVVGGSTKQEGLVLAVVVIALMALRYRDWLRGLTGSFAGAVAALLGWPAVVRLRGGGSELAERSDFDGLLRGDADVWDRVPTSATAVYAEVEFMLVVAAVSAVAGLIALSGRRRRASVGSPGWLWAIGGAHTVALLAAYAVSGYDLDYHLTHSVTRTTIVLNLLLLVDAALWLGLAFEEVASWRPASRPHGRSPAGSGD